VGEVAQWFSGVGHDPNAEIVPEVHDPLVAMRHFPTWWKVRQ